VVGEGGGMTSWEVIDAMPDPRREPELRDQDYSGCRWIEGEPVPLRPGMFCGAACLPGSAWCGEHRSLAYTRVSRARKPGGMGVLCEPAPSPEAALP
jgi:hypothetical protein